MKIDEIKFPVKVLFKKPIFEDDFPEVGMVAWLVGADYDSAEDMHSLVFDFDEFFEHNKQFFATDYYPNKHTVELGKLTGRTLFKAYEAGWYNPRYSVYFEERFGSIDEYLDFIGADKE